MREPGGEPGDVAALGDDCSRRVEGDLEDGHGGSDHHGFHVDNLAVRRGSARGSGSDRSSGGLRGVRVGENRCMKSITVQQLRSAPARRSSMSARSDEFAPATFPERSICRCRARRQPGRAARGPFDVICQVGGRSGRVVEASRRAATTRRTSRAAPASGSRQGSRSSDDVGCRTSGRLRACLDEIVTTLTLIGKPDCHLCDVAHEIVEMVRRGAARRRRSSRSVVDPRRSRPLRTLVGEDPGRSHRRSAARALARLAGATARRAGGREAIGGGLRRRVAEASRRGIRSAGETRRAGRRALQSVSPPEQVGRRSRRARDRPTRAPLRLPQRAFAATSSSSAGVRGTPIACDHREHAVGPRAGQVRLR